MADADDDVPKEEYKHLLTKLANGDSISCELIACDGPNCENKNPTKRCSRCKNHYYCSVECQRNHWSRHKKGGCLPLDVWEKEYSGRREILLQKWRELGLDDVSEEIEKGKEAASFISEDCCICLEPIQSKNLVILKECSHAFCGPCLVQWQGKNVYTSPASSKKLPQFYDLGNDGEAVPPVPDPLVLPNGELHQTLCPLCKTPSAQKVYLDCVTKAGLYKVRAEDDFLSPTMEEKKKHYENAIVELDHILGNDKLRGLFYYVHKALILIRLQRGDEALKCLEKLKQINLQRKTTATSISARLNEAMIQYEFDKIPSLKLELAEVGDTIPEDAFTQTILNVYIEVDAHMSMGRYYKAAEILFEKVGASDAGGAGLENMRKLIAETKDRGPMRIMQLLHQIDARAGECYYNLGPREHESCVESIERVIGTDRTFPGVHKWMALSYQAKAREAEDERYVVKGLETAKRGLLYEIPWFKKDKADLFNLYNDLVDDYDRIRRARLSRGSKKGKKKGRAKEGKQ